MVGKRWAEDEDDIIRTAFFLEDAASIAALLPGRTASAVRHRAKVLDLRKTPEMRGTIEHAKWAEELGARLDEPVCEWLGRRYEDEEATYRELTAEAGINTRSLMRLMTDCHIDPITPSQAVKRHLERDPEWLKRTFKARNMPEALRKRALHRQENWAEVQSSREFHFLVALRNAALSPVPEYAIGRYNIDFAFPRSKLAVELDPCWHKADSKREIDERKDALLERQGWTVLRLDARTSTSWNIHKIIQALNDCASTQP